MYIYIYIYTYTYVYTYTYGHAYIVSSQAARGRSGSPGRRVTATARSSHTADLPTNVI